MSDTARAQKWKAEEAPKSKIHNAGDRACRFNHLSVSIGCIAVGFAGSHWVFNTGAIDELQRRKRGCSRGGFPGRSRVADYQTVPSFLQAKLSLASQRDVRVYNFGRCFYQCTQERLLFEQLLLAGRLPHLAVFIDGLNDFYFADGAPEYAERFQQLLSGELARRLQYRALTNLPVVHVLESLSQRGPGPDGTTERGEALLS